jgi:monooxygenase
MTEVKQPAAHVDVLIIGAGISGVSMAWHIQKMCSDKSYIILERRQQMGGTWDLFRYPGIRSDSDMFTLGFRFKPWHGNKAIADGSSILKYVNEAADQYGIRSQIQFNRHVLKLEWSSRDALWTVTTRDTQTNETVSYTAGFIAMCAGYYSYDTPYTPAFEGLADFKGRFFHPQHWPEDLDYSGKKVVVIGSGATAVTIIPVMAETAGHVTMLQRSPTYMGSRPSEDGFANSLMKVLPASWAYGLIRWRNILIQQFFFWYARTQPKKVKARLLEMVKEELPAGYDIETHFTPRYNPWDERLCLVPDSDMFHAISKGSASVETGHIERFTETGIKLKDGRQIEADIIISATGLTLSMMGAADIVLNGQKVDIGQTLAYKGMMASNVPNLSITFGYTNASWTLKADLTSEYVCRLLKHMDASGARVATAVPQGEIEIQPFLDFTSGYIKRAEGKLPQQGTQKPWRLHQNYMLDMVALRFGKVDDGTMIFSNPPVSSPVQTPHSEAAE